MSAPRLAPVTIDNRTARAIFLARHGLAGAHDWQAPGGDLAGLLDHLGFVQVDSINTVERAHHMILSARSRRYRPGHLKRLFERERGLFEHWTHDAALIPMRFFPYWHLRFARDKERLRERWRLWHRNGFEEKLADVLARVRAEGPVTARVVGEDEEKKSGGWWEWHPSKTALEFLWRTGELAICHREGFIKVFDVTERVVPEELHTVVPSPEETIDWACSSALERLGFATSGELAAFWDTVRPQEAKAWCEARLKTDLVPVAVETKAGSRQLFARPELADSLSDVPDPPDRLRILSPFDPLLRDRKRAERLFDFHYRIEVFVPAPQRRYGYYVFPILERDRMIGRIDMKRIDGALVVSAFWPEPGIALGKGRLARLEAELARVARFAGCESVVFEDGWRRETL